MPPTFSTRFVGKPEGVSNVFSTYSDYFIGGGGQYKFGGSRHQGGGGLNPHGRGAGIQSNNLILLIVFIWLPRHLANEIITIRLIRMN